MFMEILEDSVGNVVSLDTRILEVSETSIDHIITNQSIAVSIAECIDIGLSDHLALQIHFEITSEVIACTTKFRRDFREQNYLDFF